MSQIKILEIRTTLSKDEDTSSILIKDFQAIVKAERSLIAAYETFKEDLSKKVSPKENIESLRQIFEESSNRYTEIINSHKIYVELVDKKIIASLQAYNQEVKEVQRLLKDYETKNQIEDQKYQEYKKCTANTAVKRKEELQKDYNKSKEQSTTAEVSLSQKLKLYITNRNSEFKSVMQHFINRQMNLNAKSLQELTKLSNDIIKHKEFEESLQLLENLIGNKLMGDQLNQND